MHECVLAQGLYGEQSLSSFFSYSTFAYLKRNICNALRSKYGLHSYDGADAIKYVNFSAAQRDMWSLMWFYDFRFLLWNLVCICIFVGVHVNVLGCHCGVINVNNIVAVVDWGMTDHSRHPSRDLHYAKRSTHDHTMACMCGSVCACISTGVTLNDDKQR